ncbi:GNAT family N-acetyltransferase [Ornithinibacillus halophilus]|uniref:N-acetyltransferase domain-containing protein n=1 Tax=Ornithinibacillus halophilus TaxID=930117 RepID=A0A1M5JF73_9BACI|nr:GNAT family N-acetyltransferase [Ornithinibacillus halophilus]SHG39161.1 hypothetical protein SAMN05216225_103012 [Ornithinibacillus halophilus]
MIIKIEQSIAVYLEKMKPLLLENEANNNLMLGLLERIKGNPDIVGEQVYLGLVENNGETIYGFMQTKPNNWILPDIENVPNEVFTEITKFLNKNKYDVPGVIGQVTLVEQFIKDWELQNGKSAKLQVEQIIYQLDSVSVSPDKTGKLIQATSAHKDLINRWLYSFGLEANMPLTKEKAKETAETYINNESIFVWEVDGQAVSMVNNSRRTENGVTVNAVYTPDEYKRKGYATSAVAALSQKLLDEGFSFCSLYTDAANPTSNGIYKKIGYYETGTSVVYKFV